MTEFVNNNTTTTTINNKKKKPCTFLLFPRYNDICQKWTVWVVMAAVWVLGVTLGSLPTFGWNGAGRAKVPEEHECTYFAIMDEDYLR